MVCVSFFAICLHYAVVLLSGNNPWRFPQPVPNGQSLTVTDVEVIHDGIMYFPWWVCPSGKELPGVVLLPFALHVYPFCVFDLGQCFSCIWFSFSFLFISKEELLLSSPLVLACQLPAENWFMLSRLFSLCLRGKKVVYEQQELNLNRAFVSIADTDVGGVSHLREGVMG